MQVWNILSWVSGSFLKKSFSKSYFCIIFSGVFFQKRFFIFTWFQIILMFKKILSNTAYQVLAKALTALISIFLLNLLTNYLPINLFWEYGKIYNYLLVFAFLADLWLYTISIREIHKNKQNAWKIVWNILSLRLILGICIMILALLVAAFLPSYNSLLSMLAIVIVGIFTIFWLINSSILALMQAHLKMEFSLISSVAGKLLNLWIIILIIFFIFPKEWDLDYFFPFLCIMLWGLIWNIATCWLNYRYARKIVEIKFLWDKDYMLSIFRTSLPYGIAIFLWVVYMKIDIILLSVLEDPNSANTSIALYSVPMKIMEVFMLTWTFFLNSILPSLSEWFQKKDKKLIESLLKKSYLFLLSASVSMLLFWYFLKDTMVRIIANADYLDRSMYQYTSSDAFIIVLLMIVFYFMFLLFQYVFIAAEKQSELLKINIAITLFNIVWNIILIPKYSFVWAGIVTVISQFLLMILAYFYSQKVFAFSIPKKQTAYVLLIGTMLFGLLYMWQRLIVSL